MNEGNVDICFLSRFSKGAELAGKGFWGQKIKILVRRWKVDFKIPKWYTIKTHPMKEKVAKINLENQKIEVYLPMKARTLYLSGKIVKKMDLFSPLIFLQSFQPLKCLEKSLTQEA